MKLLLPAMALFVFSIANAQSKDTAHLYNLMMMLKKKLQQRLKKQRQSTNLFYYKVVETGAAGVSVLV
jgi:hypothetical protein